MSIILPADQKPIHYTPPDLNHPMADGLVAAFLFNEYSSARVVNAMNPSLGAIFLPSGGPAPDWKSDYIVFDGSNYLQLDVDRKLNLTSDLSIIARVRYDSPVQYAAIFAGYDVGVTEVGYGFAAHDNNTDRKPCFWSDAQGSWVKADDAAPNKEWVTIGVSLLGGTAYFYIDGEPAGSAACKSPGAWAGQKRIGAASAGAFWFKDAISWVQVYDRGLSLPEMVNIHSEPFAVFTLEEQARLLGVIEPEAAAAMDEDTRADFLWTPTWVIPLVPDVGVLESPDDRYIKDRYQMHSNVEKMFDLVFEGVTDTTRNKISRHYSRVTGPYRVFDWTTVPSYINEGTTMTVRYVDRSYKEDVKSKYWTIEMTFEEDI